MNLKRFPRCPLTFGPTPIQPLKRLSAHLGGKVDLYAKREDCNSGLAFGGNKTRKLEYLIPEALAQGCDTLVSIGGIQSNQTRQVAAVAAHLGMKCVLVQENWVNYSDAVYDRVGNIVVCSVTGSTQAGMMVGFAADGRADRVIGIDASATPAKTKAQILRIAQNTAKLVELGREITDQDMVLDSRYGGPAYGLPNEGTMEAIRLCARQEGVLTDPVYEGKSMHGMINMVRLGEFPPGSKVLYAHLGGVPALNAYSFLFRNG